MRGQCTHYTGLLPGLGGVACCKAGVDYRAAFGSEAGLFLRMPCIIETPTHVSDGNGQMVKIWKPRDRRGHAMVPCDKFRLQTQEEMEAERRKLDEALAKAMAGIKVASAWRVKRPQADRHEVVECPICNGKLHLSQSAVNGHVHGKCETDGCVAWME